MAVVGTAKEMPDWCGRRGGKKWAEDPAKGHGSTGHGVEGRFPKRV